MENFFLLSEFWLITMGSSPKDWESRKLFSCNDHNLPPPKRSLCGRFKFTCETKLYPPLQLQSQIFWQLSLHQIRGHHKQCKISSHESRSFSSVANVSTQPLQNLSTDLPCVLNSLHRTIKFQRTVQNPLTTYISHVCWSWTYVAQRATKKAHLFPFWTIDLCSFS